MWGLGPRHWAWLEKPGSGRGLGKDSSFWHLPSLRHLKLSTGLLKSASPPFGSLQELGMSLAFLLGWMLFQPCGPGA